MPAVRGAQIHAGVWSASEHRCEAERAGEGDRAGEEGVYTETQRGLVKLIKTKEKNDDRQRICSIN